MQNTLFLQEWKASIRKHAEQIFPTTGTPIDDTINMMFGTGPFSSNHVQATIPLNELQRSKSLAFDAIRNIVEASEVTQSYTQIRQKPTEPFLDFAERLKDVLAKQFKFPEAHDSMFQKLAIEQVNEDCQRILRTLKDPTPMDMVKACRDVIPTTTDKLPQAEAMAAQHH
ncbi:hypothetical protein BTVI_54321 [Pitangus sulphuratus]|nr:hypothetical protein BTVI_54321 [Pitangus sulphuratus]